MKRVLNGKNIHMLIMAAALAAGLSIGSGVSGGTVALAEEAMGYFDEQGNWIEEPQTGMDEMAADVPSGESVGPTEETASDGAIEIMGEGAADQGADASEAAETEPSQRTGTYTVASGWAVDDAAGTQEQTVYKQEGKTGQDQTSTITCSYMDTDFSVLEYEQLRDMLTNNLLYSNVNAQLSSSAIYTDAKDYLYILIVDDASAEYRDIYCYVVGDYRCFSVQIQEYRAEAEELRAQKKQTPQEVGQSVAEGFVWN
ncbi:hypothetical protein [Parablautia sp. Marseille-Q6255]|uniref:hypothetical protein n=1 Tax=Parablautia sp. Marseille-Q6255 TaxID=3039593 RepID=UPI0024BCDD41|nr:hypothetical protein [Parablautia sp. Marseille-Q6255]